MMERDRATAYLNVKRLADNPVTIRGARAAWQAFQRTYGGYDPEGLAALLNGNPTDAPLRIPTKPASVQNPDAQIPDAPLRIPTKSVSVGTQNAASVATSTPPVLPPPFAWIDIPAGKVTVKNQTFDVAAFAIAKYPITNAQFAPFIESGGYKTRKWWTDAGWWQRVNDGWTEPCYWSDSKWNGAEQPVVGVSWYEAIATASG